MLLERLANIMQSKSTDNDNNFLQYQRSLTAINRRAELERITEDNQRLLKRIQEAEPCYNHLTWEESEKERSKLLKNMSEFPESFQENRRRLLQDNSRITSADSFGEPKRHGMLMPISSINTSTR